MGETDLFQILYERCIDGVWRTYRAALLLDSGSAQALALALALAKTARLLPPKDASLSGSVQSEFPALFLSLFQTTIVVVF